MPVNEYNFWTLFKSQLDTIKEKTLKPLLQDKQYQSSLNKHLKAEEAFSKLQLTKKQKKVIDNLLYWTDYNNMEYSTLSYLAGLGDGQKLHYHFNLSTSSSRTVPKEENLIKELYHMPEFADKYLNTSKKTQKYRNAANKLEEQFVSGLSKQQTHAFEKVMEAKIDEYLSSIHDDFICGYQLGCKTIISLYQKL